MNSWEIALVVFACVVAVTGVIVGGILLYNRRRSADDHFVKKHRRGKWVQ